MDRRPIIAYADGVDAARSAPRLVAAAAGVADPHDVDVFLGWTPNARPWLDDPELSGRTVIAGYALAGSVAAGRLQYLPVRLSSVPRLIAHLRPAVAVLSGIRRSGGLAYSRSVGWGPALARSAGAVVVEIDEGAPDLGGPMIEGPVVAELPRPPCDDAPVAPRAPDQIELDIGRIVALLIPEGATVQLGPGGVPDAIAESIDRPVGIWTGVVTDATARLHERGLLRGQITACYTWGGDPIARLAAAGQLRLVPLEETHDLTALSAIPRFVACNTALQVGLDGAVNIERVGGRIVAAIGGHADFACAAARSIGGLSIIAVRATTKAGGSTIVPAVEVVSTPRCDVDVVVTEHGIADLRGADDSERARRIIAVAAPEHRNALAP